MSKKIITTQADYTALTIVSPMNDGGEIKNQDRAQWYGRGQIACDCDGVTSSPDSAKAAEIVTAFIPAVFSSNIDERLSVVCDLLMAKRLESQEKCDINFPDGTPPAMRDMLRDVIMQKRAFSYQTTLVAARFIPDGDNVLANVIKCGDSAFFAFSTDGQLLTSSLSFISDKAPENNQQFQQSSQISFGPGDEILVRFDTMLHQNKTLLRKSSIKPEHAKNWLACTVIDSCNSRQKEDGKNLLDLRALSLNPGDSLLVPKYLHGVQLISKGKQYLILRYSSAIRPVPSVPITSLSSRGSTTMVLPDHFYCGCYDSFQDRFPKGSNFLLCSDGFYSSFADWQELWQWLKENKIALHDIQKREAILTELHSSLNSRGGDDDISFIWVSPSQEE